MKRTPPGLQCNSQRLFLKLVKEKVYNSDNTIQLGCFIRHPFDHRIPSVDVSLSILLISGFVVLGFSLLVNLNLKSNMKIIKVVQIN